MHRQFENARPLVHSQSSRSASLVAGAHPRLDRHPGTPAPPPLGILRIRGSDWRVPILEGTDEATLNRAVGHIEDTSAPARPATPASRGIATAISGHEGCALGDVIDIETTRGVATYRIARMWIVEPEDVSVLDPGAAGGDHARDVLPVLFHRLRATALHRPCGAGAFVAIKKRSNHAADNTRPLEMDSADRLRDRAAGDRAGTTAGQDHVRTARQVRDRIRRTATR
jgi:LPXTG-site transpeptidase (sortase) family protein